MQEKEIRKEGERAGQEGERARQEGERTGGWRLREEVIVARNKGADQSVLGVLDDDEDDEADECADEDAGDDLELAVAPVEHAFQLFRVLLELARVVYSTQPYFSCVPPCRSSGSASPGCP